MSTNYEPQMIALLEENNVSVNSRNMELFDELFKNGLEENPEEILKILNKIDEIEYHEEVQPNSYPEDIMKTLRKRRGLNQYDYSQDEDINQSTKDEVFDEVCNWNGFIDAGSRIRSWVESIYNIDLNLKEVF